MLKKKLVQVTAAAMAATMLFSVPAMAKKNFFSFNVKTSVNDGEAFSAGNPKNDAERQAYVVTQDSNIISTDAFYYAVFNYPKDTARYQYAYHTKMSSRTGTVEQVKSILDEIGVEVSKPRVYSLTYEKLEENTDYSQTDPNGNAPHQWTKEDAAYAIVFKIFYGNETKTGNSTGNYGKTRNFNFG